MEGDGEEHVRAGGADGLGQHTVLVPLGSVLIHPFKVQVHTVQRVCFDQFRYVVRKSLTRGGIGNHGRPRPAGNAEPDAHAGNARRPFAQAAQVFRPGSGIAPEDIAIAPAGDNEAVIPIGLYFRTQTIHRPGQMPHAHFINPALQIPPHYGIRRAVHIPRGSFCRSHSGTVHVKNARSLCGIPDEGQPEVFMEGNGRQIRLPGGGGANLQTGLVMVVRP